MARRKGRGRGAEGPSRFFIIALVIGLLLLVIMFVAVVKQQPKTTLTGSLAVSNAIA